LDYFEPEIAPLDPPSPKTPPNMEWIGRPVAEIWPFEMLVAFRFAICRFLYPMSIIIILLKTC